MFKHLPRIMVPKFSNKNPNALSIRVLDTIAILTAVDLFIHLLRYITWTSFYYETAIQAGAILFAALSARTLLYIGYRTAANVLILGGLWSVLSWSALVSGGIQSIGFTVLILAIFAAGILVNNRGLAIFASGVILTAAILLLLQSTNQLPEPRVEQTPLQMWAIYTLLVVATGLFAAYTLTRLSSTLLSLQEKEQVLHKNNQELAAQHKAQTEIKLQLEHSKSLLEATFEAIADGIVVVDNNQDLVAINQKFRIMWDLPLHDEISRMDMRTHISNLIKSSDEYLAKIREIYVDPALESHEQVQLHDGRSYEYLSMPQRMGESIIGRVWTFRDITALKKSEDALQESTKRFRDIFELAPIGMAILDLDGRFVQVNKSLCQTFGYDREELQEMNVLQLSHPDDLNAITDIMDKFVNDEISSCQLEKRVLHRDNSVVDILIQVSPIKDKGKCPQYAIAQIIDLTERKRSEEALRQAQKLESLGIMSGGIAHDFNNLLTGILAQSTLALSYLSPQSKVYANIENVVSATKRAADLTRQLLAYSGRGQFENRPIHVNEIVQESLNLAATAIASNATLEIELADSLPLTKGDAGQIQQVLMNLIMNAAEAIEGNNGIIEITTDSITVSCPDEIISVYEDDSFAPGDYVSIEIKDNGKGMDNKTLAIIFDPFYTTKMTGRGLGLAAVLGIVRGHGGMLQVESEVGKGTRFRLLLPIITEKTILEADVTSDAQSNVQPSAQSGTVLVIDDHKEIQQTVSEILSLEGIHTLTASDGASGVQLFDEQARLIDLVLLDLTMPGLSGEETLVQLRKIDSNVPIILTSGYSESETAERFMESQATDFLAKPYSWEQLINIIQKHLG